MHEEFKKLLGRHRAPTPKNSHISDKMQDGF